MNYPNLRADPVIYPKVIKSHRKDKFEAEDPVSKSSSSHEDPGSKTSTNDTSSPFSYVMPMPAVNPNDFVGRTLLLDKEGVQRLRDQIVNPPRQF